MDRIVTRIAVALLLVTMIAVGIIAVGVLGVSKSEFSGLMTSQGESSQMAREMFDQSVTRIFLLAAGVALAVSVTLAAILAIRITRPLQRIERGAHALAAGEYATRVPAEGTRELAAVATTFNKMAESLQAGESVRRQLIADFAHELRTPLTSLFGYLEGMRDGLIEPSPELLASLSEEVERLHRLSRSLDVLSDSGSLAAGVVEVDVGSAVAHAADIARPGLTRRSVELVNEAQAGLRGRADPDRLAQVLQNLLSNAANYTPVGGRVVVSTQLVNGGVVVSIANTGEAIPEAELPRLWERFYRLDKSRDRARGGAGIGLAIVKQLVETAGGTVGAESQAGFNRFWFTVPAANTP